MSSSSEETEQRLAATPTRQLSDEARLRITDAVLAADGGRRLPWWSRRVPLWQAAAACLAMCAVTILLARSNPAPTTPQVREPPPEPHRIPSDTPNVSTFVSVDPSIFGARRRPAYRTDIARWRAIENHQKGQQTP